MVGSVLQAVGGGQEDDLARRGDLARFRESFYGCLSARADALFELTDALLCTEGPVKTLVELAMAPEHRRGHGEIAREQPVAGARDRAQFPRSSLKMLGR